MFANLMRFPMIKRNPKSTMRFEVRVYEGRKVIKKVLTDDYYDAMNVLDQFEYDDRYAVEFCDHKPGVWNA